MNRKEVRWWVISEKTRLQSRRSLISSLPTTNLRTIIIILFKLPSDNVNKSAKNKADILGTSDSAKLFPEPTKNDFRWIVFLKLYECVQRTVFVGWRASENNQTYEKRNQEIVKTGVHIINIIVVILRELEKIAAIPISKTTITQQRVPAVATAAAVVELWRKVLYPAAGCFQIWQGGVCCSSNTSISSNKLIAISSRRKTNVETLLQQQQK